MVKSRRVSPVKRPGLFSENDQPDLVLFVNRFFPLIPDRLNTKFGLVTYFVDSSRSVSVFLEVVISFKVKFIATNCSN